MTERTSSTDAAAPELTITRVFAAPRELVFKAWTELERLRQWWGPQGFTWVTGTLDLRPGGVFHYGMRAPDGADLWGKFVYREVTPPERLAFVSAFSDAAGNTVRAPFSATWPLEILNVLSFAEQEGRTTLTMQGYTVNATEAERKTFAEWRDSVQQGFAGTFAQLDAHLAAA
ncbi:MAG TPA: SRPBCC domain-containing protein [Dehalococcoidia bacterium]|nr:SRPBCC domain-containing protein [Dehalococcoidia bacterium]